MCMVLYILKKRDNKEGGNNGDIWLKTTCEGKLSLFCVGHSLRLGMYISGSDSSSSFHRSL